MPYAYQLSYDSNFIGVVTFSHAVMQDYRQCEFGDRWKKWKTGNKDRRRGAEQQKDRLLLLAVVTFRWLVSGIEKLMKMEVAYYWVKDNSEWWEGHFQCGASTGWQENPSEEQGKQV